MAETWVDEVEYDDVVFVVGGGSAGCEFAEVEDFEKFGDFVSVVGGLHVLYRYVGGLG